MGTESITNALRQSENRYRLLLNALMHGVQECDCTGTITYSNQAHHRILGYEAGELLGKKIWDVSPSPSDKEQLRNYFARLLQEQPAPTPYITKNIRKDGTLVDLQIDWDYARDHNGTLTGFVSIITDITKRKRLEEDLHTRSQGFVSLLEISKRLAATLDLQSVLQVSVDSVTKLVGLDTAAVYLLEDKTLHLWATFPPLPPQFPEEMRDAPLADHAHINSAIKSQEPVFIYDYLKADLTPAERAIAEERNLRTLLFIPLILDTNALGVFIVGSIAQPSDLPDFEINLSRTLASLVALTVRNAQLYEESRKNAAKLEQMLADRIQMENEKSKLVAQLQNAQKLESIGVLAGGIAHDFNNILAAILGNIDIALFDSDLPLETQKRLMEAEKASIRAKDLTQQLLTFSKGGQPITETASLVEVVRESAEFVLHGEKVVCKFDFPDDLWLAEIDKGQISQVVQNIVLNASQSMPEGGTIEISCENFTTKESNSTPILRAGNYIKLTIKDSGVGMPATVLNRIFDPYFSTKQKGNGLGLAITYSIMQKHNGHIEVESLPGVGTTFTIFIPAANGQPIFQQIEEHTEHADASRKIMIMDDDEQVREMAGAMLTTMGHETVLAEDGAEALALYAKSMKGGSPIDLIIMDLTIPGELGGKEAAKRVLAINPQAKIIVSSGYSTDPIMSSFQEHGFCGTLVKPYQRKDLAKVIKEAFIHSEDKKA